MKTKVLLITVFAGIFMLVFASCEKQVTNAKIKVVETNITRLEKNYGDMTPKEFNETYDNYMDELKEISHGDVTKNQKKKVSDLKWRMRKVRVRYYNPLGEVHIKGDGSLLFFASNSLVNGRNFTVTDRIQVVHSANNES